MHKPKLASKDSPLEQHHETSTGIYVIHNNFIICIIIILYII